jgi:hypothetical protein
MPAFPRRWHSGLLAPLDRPKSIGRHERIAAFEAARLERQPSLAHVLDK